MHTAPRLTVAEATAGDEVAAAEGAAAAPDKLGGRQVGGRQPVANRLDAKNQASMPTGHSAGWTQAPVDHGFETADADGEG